MKCREFMDAAELLTPTQLLRLQPGEQPLSAHAQECLACGRWLESHRLLGNALNTLRTATEPREAGPAVEATVLQAVRAGGFAARAVTMPKQIAPAMWRLSRFFEFGAYAAVAAALVVGLFLGSRILRDKPTQSPTSQAQTTSAPQTTQPENQVASGNSEAMEKLKEKTGLTAVARVPVAKTRQSQQAAAKAESSTNDQAGYVAVMLCDPLICSGDEQVIRMELPGTVSTNGSNAQTVLADVVIGEDGLVRAMRIVNE